jgi:hypothetical protein
MNLELPRLNIKPLASQRLNDIVDAGVVTGGARARLPSFAFAIPCSLARCAIIASRRWSPAVVAAPRIRRQPMRPFSAAAAAIATINTAPIAAVRLRLIHHHVGRTTGAPRGAAR